jgi:hypothetical protein
MNTEIVVAIITGCLALAGTAIGTYGGIKTSQKVNEVKIEELTREVREHNNFAKRMPVVEAELGRLNTRVKELEGLHKREV